MGHRVIGAYQKQRKHIGAYQWHIKCSKSHQRHMEHYEAKSTVNEAFQSISNSYVVQKLKRRPWRCNHIILIQSMNRNNSPKLWMSYQTYRGCSGISVRMWFIHFWMTTWQKSPTSGSSIHPRLGEVKGAGRASQALSNIPQSGTPQSGQISAYQNIPQSGTPQSGQISAYPLPFLAKVQTIPHTRVQKDSFNNK